MTSAVEPPSPGTRTFAELLDWHLWRGTRPKGTSNRNGEAWTNKAFAGCFGTHERTVRNWRNGRSIPPEIVSIERALFGDTVAYDAWRTELRDAFRLAVAKKGGRPVETSSSTAESARAEAPPPRRPCNLPYPSIGPLFKGRDAFLAKLHAALAGGGQAAAVTGKALHGLGGVGKTRLAVEYGWRHAAARSAVLFVRADTPALLATSLAALAGPDILDLPEKDAPADHIKIPAALNWLEAHTGWLMILDNVDDEDAAGAAQDLLTRLRGGHVLITGRLSNFSAAVKKLELGVLEPGDAAAFLLERTDGDRDAAPDDSALAHALAQELGGLALGLEQAGAYVATERVSLARYLRLWREKRETVTGWFDRRLMTYDHDTGLAATWATSVDRLKPESRKILERLAFFAPDPIPKSLLDAAEPGSDAAAALSGLYAYSLVQQAEVETGKQPRPGFAVHRLVQDFTWRAMTEARRDEALGEALAWMSTGCEGDPQDVRTWVVLDPLAAHAQTLANHDGEAKFAEPTARLYGVLNLLFHAKARYLEAESASRRALAIHEASHGPDHPNVATGLNNLAGLLKETNRPSDAEPLYRRALAIDEASHGPDHPTVAIGLNNLAALLQETNRPSDAEPLFRRALAIDEASHGPDHPNVAIRLNNLAGLLRQTNRPSDAEPLYRRALAIHEASHGPDHPNVATGLNNLAGLLQDTNRPSDAEPLYRRALAIDEASHGPDHPTVAIDLNNLAALLQETNRPSDAEPLYRRALAINEASHGPDHPTVATGLNNLAGLLRQTNRPSDAEPLYRRALAINEASHGPDHPTVAIRLNNLAGLLKETNRPSDAEPLYRRALAIDEASHGPDHPTVAIRLNNLAGLLKETNRPSDAEPLYRRALAIDEASHGPDHPTVAIDLNNLAALLQETNRPSDAEPLYRRALAIDEASHGPDHPTVATGLNNLALLLQETNRPSDAEPLYRRALAIDEASHGPDHPTVAIDLNNLAGLLQETNRPSDAEPLYRRALAINEASHGPDHPTVAIRLWWLATLLRDTNQLSDAEPLYRRALAIFEASHGPEHPHTITVGNHLAALLAQIQPPRDEAD